MNMLKKIKIGLSMPKQIIQFRFERIGATILYFFVMVLITLIPTLIDLIKLSSLDPATKNEIKNDFVDAGGANCNIQNQTLSCIQAEPTMIRLTGLQPFIVVFDPSNTYTVPSNSTAILFGEKGVYFKQSGLSLEIVQYENHPSFEGMDFNNSSSRTDNTFWDPFFEIVDYFIQANKGSIVSVGLFAGFISIALDQATTLLFMAALLYMLNSVYRMKFGELFRITTYAMTPYIFIQLIAILLNVSIIVYVGMIMTGIYAITAVRQITNQFQQPGKED